MNGKQLQLKFWEDMQMISIGIDVSKGKSMVCILKPYGEVISSPFEVEHTETAMHELVSMLLKFDDELKVIM